MVDPRIAWFAMGATFGMVLCGWPWHPRFSRYGPPRGSYGSPRRPSPLPATPAPGYRREYFYSPSTVAECGGPCEAGPEYCNCGQLWRDVPIGLPRGSNPPAPGTNPEPPASPPEAPSTPAGCPIGNAAQIAECGGPCLWGPSHCDCGQLRVAGPVERSQTP